MAINPYMQQLSGFRPQGAQTQTEPQPQPRQGFFGRIASRIGEAVDYVLGDPVQVATQNRNRAGDRFVNDAPNITAERGLAGLQSRGSQASPASASESLAYLNSVIDSDVA